MSRGTPSIDYHNRLSRTEALMKYSDQIQKFYFYNSHSILFLEYEALYCMYLVCGKICQISWVLHVGGLDWSWSRPTILNTELCWGQGWFLYHQDSWLLLLALPPWSSAQLLSHNPSEVSCGVLMSRCPGVVTQFQDNLPSSSGFTGRDAGFDMSLSRLVLHSLPSSTAVTA